MSGWHYKRENGEIVGILSEDEIKSCAQRGGITLDSPVMHEEHTRGQWVAAGRLKSLRKRIEASPPHREAQSAAAPPAPSVYVPPPQPRIPPLPLKSLAAGIHGAASGAIGAMANVLERLAAKRQLHTCLKCEREFAKYEILGKCPLCGEWAVVACETCGLESGAKRFVENDCKCPRCGDKVTV